MNVGQKPGDRIAVIGKANKLQTVLSAEFDANPGCTVFREKIPYYSDLSIRDNAQQLKMMLCERDVALFEELLELSELTREGWTHTFRKDMTGEKKLYGLLAAMITRPNVLLVYDLLSGMKTRQREAFARMAECFYENGCTLVYTSQTLKDVMRLEFAQEIWISGKGGFIKTDTAAVAAKCAELKTPEQIDALYRRMEAGENV